MHAPSPKPRSSVVVLPRNPRTNVRLPLGPFIGREKLLARIGEVFDTGARLVTLLGPPGIGETAHAFLERRGASYDARGGA